MFSGRVYAERDVFFSQAASLVLAIALNIALTSVFGIAGTVATLVLGSTAYFLMSGFCICRRPSFNGPDMP